MERTWGIVFSGGACKKMSTFIFFTITFSSNLNMVNFNMLPIHGVIYRLDIKFNEISGER